MASDSPEIWPNNVIQADAQSWRFRSNWLRGSRSAFGSGPGAARLNNDVILPHLIWRIYFNSG